LNRAGDICEIRFTLAAVKKGFTVFTPHSHATKVDLILHKQGQPPVTCQVKKGSRVRVNKKPTYKVIVGSAKPSNSSGPRINRYNESDFDVLVVDIEEYGFTFWNVADVCHQTTFRWNESKPSNNWDIFTRH